MAAVEPTWSVDFGSVFDNREGDNKYAEAKTFFFTNLAVEGGIKFTKHDRISAGAVWNQPVANDIDDATVRPIVSGASRWVCFRAPSCASSSPDSSGVTL